MTTYSLTTFSLLLLIVTSPLFTQTSIPFGSTPTIDGEIASGEWDDTESLVINPDGVVSSEIHIKHDGENLYVAFMGAFGSSFFFPEILVDPDNSKATGWEQDDWWFHVSATDCESQSAPSVYDNCLLEQK